MRGKLKVERTALIVIGARCPGRTGRLAGDRPARCAHPAAGEKVLPEKEGGAADLPEQGGRREPLPEQGGRGARFAPKGEAYSRSESDALYLRPEGTIEVTAGPVRLGLLGRLRARRRPSPTSSTRPGSNRARKRSRDRRSSRRRCRPSSTGGKSRSSPPRSATTPPPTPSSSTPRCSWSNSRRKSGATPPTEEIATDSTARTDNACRTYRSPSPVPIGRDKVLSLSVLIDFSTKASASFLIGRTSFVLLP